MRRFLPFTFGALGLAAISAAVVHAETGLISGQIDGQPFELHLDADDATFGLDLDLFRRSGVTYLEADLMALEKTSDGYSGLLLFLELEAIGEASRDSMEGGKLLGAEVMIIDDWPLGASDPRRAWLADFDASEDIEISITDGVLSLVAQFSSDRFCLHKDMDSVEPVPVYADGEPVCTTGELALGLGTTSDRPAPLATTESVEVLGQIAGTLGDEHRDWLTILPVGGMGAATATAELDDGKVVALRIQGHSPASENFLARDVLSILLHDWPALEVGHSVQAEVLWVLDSPRNFYTSDEGEGSVTATIGSLEMAGDLGQVALTLEGRLCRVESLTPVPGSCLPFSAEVTTEVLRDAP